MTRLEAAVYCFIVSSHVNVMAMDFFLVWCRYTAVLERRALALKKAHAVLEVAALTKVGGGLPLPLPIIHFCRT